MKEDYEKFLEKKATVVVIARHSEEDIEEYWKKHTLPFDAVADPDKKLGDLYGQEWKALKLGLMPALFVIGGDGRIAYAHYSASMSDIPANDSILQVLEVLQQSDGKASQGGNDAEHQL